MDDKIDEPGASFVPAGPGEVAPLFQAEWWLGAASGGQHERVNVTWDGRLVGTLPYYRTRRAGLIRLRSPPYTRTLGPVLHLPSSKTGQRQANLRRVVGDLAAQLPHHDYFDQALEPGSEYTQAFHLAGFDCLHAFTFRIAADEPRDELWAALDKRLRNVIHTHGRQMNIEDSNDFDRFLRLSRSKQRQGGATHNYAALERLYKAASCRGQAAMRCAVGPTGDQAIALLVWDARTLYYWVNARAAGPISNRANAVLVWDAIACAQARRLEFDFDSYSSRDAAIFMESFGRCPITRPVIRRSSPLYRAAFWLGKLPLLRFSNWPSKSRQGRALAC